MREVPGALLTLGVAAIALGNGQLVRMFPPQTLARERLRRLLTGRALGVGGLAVGIVGGLLLASPTDALRILTSHPDAASLHQLAHAAGGPTLVAVACIAVVACWRFPVFPPGAARMLRHGEDVPPLTGRTERIIDGGFGSIVDAAAGEPFFRLIAPALLLTLTDEMWIVLLVPWTASVLLRMYRGGGFARAALLGLLSSALLIVTGGIVASILLRLADDLVAGLIHPELLRFARVRAARRAAAAAGALRT